MKEYKFKLANGMKGWTNMSLEELKKSLKKEIKVIEFKEKGKQDGENDNKKD